MLYAILCYNSESAVRSWTPEHDQAVMERHGQVMASLAAQGRLGPVARLQDTRTAVTARSRDGAIVDGPFAETKEQLLGFYVVDCKSLEEATELAKQLVEAPGCMEVRPVHTYIPPSLTT